jgi:small subunit ribosomal protein S20
MNNWRKRRIKTQTKAFLTAVQEQNLQAAEAEFRKACGLLDRISCTSTLHKNAASRRKRRLSKRLAALKRPAAS